MPFPGAHTNGTGAGWQRPAPVRVILPLLMALWGPALPLSANQSCTADRIDERVRVSFAQDGDTLMLGDGRRLRLIGINTPELGKHGSGAEPGAIAARDRLRQLIFVNQQQLSLRFDQEHNDRYGRLLAHAFFSDGRSLTEQLLTEGAGTQLVVPPNTWRSDCYRRAVRTARQQRTGIWALPEYQPISASQLNLHSTGFHIVHGQVSHLSSSAQAIWVNLVGNLALRIERRDLDNFQGFDLDALVGSEIEAQGWIYARDGQLRMPVRHPVALDVITPRPPIAGSAPLE